jgi:hypothetical protein
MQTWRPAPNVYTVSPPKMAIFFPKPKNQEKKTLKTTSKPYTLNPRTKNIFWKKSGFDVSPDARSLPLLLMIPKLACVCKLCVHGIAFACNVHIPRSCVILYNMYFFWYVTSV